MKKALFYLFLLILTGCEWADPTLKTLKNCVLPTDIMITPDATDSRRYTFSIVTATITDIKTVTWKVLNGTTVLITSTLNANQTYNYTASVSGNYTVTAEVEMVCGDKKTLTKPLSIKICTPPNDISVAVDPSDSRKFTFGLVTNTPNDVSSVTWRFLSTSQDLGNGSLNGVDKVVFIATSGLTVAVSAIIKTTCGQTITLTKTIIPEFKVWDKTVGGYSEEVFKTIIATPDGGYLMGGYSLSGASGEKSEGSRGERDFWVVKTSAQGQKIWDKTYGGSAADELNSIVATSDGGFLLGGNSASNISGEKTENSRGENDYWVVKINASGVKQWDKTYGGINNDSFGAMIATPDGGFLLSGSSLSSASGEKSEAIRGDLDWWVIKVNANGIKQWDKTFGGSRGDYLYDVIPTNDGGYLLGGNSESNAEGEKSENSRGTFDYWLVKINSSGQKQWDKTYGGNASDVLYNMIQTPDGGFLLSGSSLSSASGEKSENSQGLFDYWLIKINSNGQKQWDKGYGGARNEERAKIVATPDGGFLIGGQTDSSVGGDRIEELRGNLDYWLIKVNSNGLIQWTKLLGSANNDYVHALFTTSDGGYIIGGSSDSNISGEKSENSRGGSDFWIVKVK